MKTEKGLTWFEAVVNLQTNTLKELELLDGDTVDISNMSFSKAEKKLEKVCKEKNISLEDIEEFING